MRWIAILCVVSFAASATAQDTPMEVVVQEVKGLVQVRDGDDQPWKKVEAGMKLTQGAEFRTGPKSSVTCTIPPDQTIVLDRLGTVKILEAMQSGGKIKTDLVMKYGRTDYAIEAAGREHESTIRSPSSTLAVRGTRVRLYDQPPFTPEAQTFTGRATYQFAKRQMSVRKGGRARGGQGTAETALVESAVDPESARARTTSDANLIANEQSRGAVVTYDPQFRLPIVRGGAGPRTDAELAQSLPGVLNFVVRWDQNVDVDIVTTVAPGDQLQTLQAAATPETVLLPFFGLNTTPTGGRIAFDHRGGPNGGQEICFWPGQFPTAVYGLGAINNSTTQSADVRFNAFLNGEKLSLFNFAPDGSLVRSTGFVSTLAPDGTDAVLALAPPLEIFEDPELIPEVPDETIDGTTSVQAPASVRELKPSKEIRRAERREARAREIAAIKAERLRQKELKAVGGKRGR